ncbi:hypothetical protein JCM19376_41140 [Fusibacter bizertensis]
MNLLKNEYSCGNKSTLKEASGNCSVDFEDLEERLQVYHSVLARILQIFRVSFRRGKKRSNLRFLYILNIMEEQI